jgi:hypothetical protein
MVVDRVKYVLKIQERTVFTEGQRAHIAQHASTSIVWGLAAISSEVGGYMGSLQFRVEGLGTVETSSAIVLLIGLIGLLLWLMFGMRSPGTSTPPPTRKGVTRQLSLPRRWATAMPLYISSTLPWNWRLCVVIHCLIRYATTHAETMSGAHAGIKNVTSTAL